MKKTGRLQILIGVGLVLFFSAGLAQLFRLRFEQGDIYPAYSSLRSDPLGTRVLYESLASCNGVKVERNREPITRLDLAGDSVLLLLGDTFSPEERIPRNIAAHLNRFIRRGARLVVTLSPQNREQSEEADEAAEENDEAYGDEEGFPAKDTEADVQPEKSVAEDEGESDGDDDPAIETMPVTEWLGLSVEDVPYTGAVSATRPETYPDDSLPMRITCHTSVCFRDLTNSWKIVYARAGRPVIVERQLGSGTIILSSLSFFVSNEALRQERHPRLLAWLIGDASRIVFDEYHHGLIQSQGLMILARRYRLHGVGVVLLLLAGLFFWRQSVELVPPQASSPPEPETETGRGSRSALINILRRNIPASNILQTSLNEWKRIADLKDAKTRQRFEEAGRLVEENGLRPRAKRDYAGTYNKVCNVLHPQRTRMEEGKKT